MSKVKFVLTMFILCLKVLSGLGVGADQRGLKHLALNSVKTGERKLDKLLDSFVMMQKKQTKQ